MAVGDDKGAGAACPVDHRSRDACPVDHSSSKSPESCPVDHKSREVWLSQARAAAAAAAAAATPTSHPPAKSPAPSSSSSSWNPLAWRIPFFSSSSSSGAAQNAQQQPSPPSQTPPKRASHLDEGRVVSSIPRATSSSSSPKTPSNHENESGADAATGNWVYPSENMFFDALRRKGNTGGARAADMRTVVPIHNAVNERAWHEIKAWEAPYRCRHRRGEEEEGNSDNGDKDKNGCAAGPRLESFSGLAAKLSPRARLNTWLGYTAPFDRHDWVVDRCGVRVEYVIDFYAGRPSAAAPADASHKLNFYLDVRPKLNTWEGVKMRVLRALGVV
ncbi:cytochrome c1 heme lyase [Magnaporthiopsis poae ATCC 64411]|uniref:Holocytochrome c-type synthase n=1 Tax=Magnaporthiopsis poae (strain ATCC 64411 / 73-15) TaxID=644358 RepID=A0A0C4E0P4_MAGP6|nr:cytochrome c1 heme lyase [Magnaporthiopsis poae ATCC 64411]